MRHIALAMVFVCFCAKAQIITTVAGADFVFPSQPIPGPNAPLGQISGISVDASGNVYASDLSNNRVMLISPNGIVSVVAGNGILDDVAGETGDGGPATAASIPMPTAVAVDAAGDLYIGSFGYVRKVSGGTITTVVGGGRGSLGDGGPATSATIYEPAALAFDAAGNLYIADSFDGRIRKVSNGTITTVAGNGSGPGPANPLGNLGDGGPATNATLSNPSGVACDSSGNLYIADSGNYRIRKVSPGGIITTVVGNGHINDSGDGGPAIAASLEPTSVALDAAGNLYIADFYHRIRKVSQGIISTVAGTGANGFSGDGGPAVSATLESPRGIAVGSNGTIYFGDSPQEFELGSGRVREVMANGNINTLAGNGLYGFSGDGGPAVSATLSWLPPGPSQSAPGLAVDGRGNVYIADTANNRVRMVSGGIITTVAGDGIAGFSGDGGPASSAELNFPTGVAVDSAGNLYIVDLENFRIREVSNGTITTLASTAKIADGLVTAIAGDSAGDLFLAGGNRVWKLSQVSRPWWPVLALRGFRATADQPPTRPSKARWPWL